MKSQPHQPPQDNSCSAQQQPKKNENNVKKNKVPITLPCIITIFFQKNFFEKNKNKITTIKNNAYVVYNIPGCINIIPLSRLSFGFIKLIFV